MIFSGKDRNKACLFVYFVNKTKPLRKAYQQIEVPPNIAGLLRDRANKFLEKKTSLKTKFLSDWPCPGLLYGDMFFFGEH